MKILRFQKYFLNHEIFTYLKVIYFTVYLYSSAAVPPPPRCNSNRISS